MAVAVYPSKCFVEQTLIFQRIFISFETANKFTIGITKLTSYFAYQNIIIIENIAREY
jgi:hypothetical protein